ncbi:MAG: peptidase M14, partial [Gramella sp.]|nr:peptidase M14 [Christiangramia sp.]
MQKLYLIAFLIFSVSSAWSQDFEEKLYEDYQEYKEPEITNRRFKHALVTQLLDKHSDGIFKIQQVGESIEGRSLNLVSIGTGETQVFLWSQMHGDESTATMAIFDILNFFESAGFEAEKELMLSKLSIHFLPMLNPDGAEVFHRRNALGVDINRDALRLQSPESQTLKRIRDSLDANFGFNLH